MLPLCVLLFSSALVAQIPDGYVTIHHYAVTGTSQSSAVALLESGTGVISALRFGGVKLTGLARAGIVHPGDPTQMLFFPGLSQVGATMVQRIGLQGNVAAVGATVAVTGTQSASARLAIVGTDLYISNASAAAPGGVYKVALTGTVAAQIATFPRANAMTVFNGKLYVADYLASNPSSIVEIDPTTNAMRAVGTGYTALRALGSFAGSLLAGNDNGELVAIVPTTGQATVLAAPNLGSIVSVTTVGVPFFATRNNQVWRFPNYTTPVFTSSGAIQELSAGTKPVATTIAFGAGCPGFGTNAIQYLFTTHPTVPSPGFTLSIQKAKPLTPGVFTLGTSRLFWNTTPLPLDLSPLNMSGCWLYSDPLVTAGVATDSAGVATLPLPIPNVPGLVGGHLMSQFFAVDSTTNPIGVTSEGYELILQ